ncbi:unnamed protein product [Parnassius apollo]|uniref:(apollo) hypothetical protein n=1 Tax=Parnassius apollo TaxID=110799 RepID=A0A8S3Y3F1_PARAO|nr:unnamed protein product [Parnassius apollo]
MTLNLEKCRLCLKLGNFYSIFTKDNNLQLAEMVMECARVKIHMGDGLPDKICTECIQKLSSAYIFKQQCERSDQELRRHYVSQQTCSSSSTTNIQSSVTKTNNSCDNKSNQSLNDNNTFSIETNTEKSNTPTLSSKVCLPESSANRINKKSSVLPNTRKKLASQKQKTILQKQEHKRISKRNGSNNLKAQSSVSSNKISKAKSIGLGVTKSSSNTKNMPDVRETKLNLKCNKCSETFKLNIMLKRHLQNCSKSSRKSIQEIPASPQQLVNFSCEICTAKFRTMQNLQKHMKVVHTTVLKQVSHETKVVSVKINMPCLYCNVSFSSYSVYCAHFNSCSKKYDISTFVCPICHRKIIGKSAYFIHIKNFHFEPQEDVKLTMDIKPSSYMCCLCSIVLSTPELLKKHLESHRSISIATSVSNESRASISEKTADIFSVTNKHKLSSTEENFNLEQQHDPEKRAIIVKSIDIT